VIRHNDASVPNGELTEITDVREVSAVANKIGGKPLTTEIAIRRLDLSE
jgi:hypothetical protein